MKALISPNEIQEHGCRVAEVCAKSFDVAPPLFWVNCDSSIVPDLFFYDLNTKKFIQSSELVVEQTEVAEQPNGSGIQDL